MPAFDWNASFALVREKYPDLPYIIVSGNIGEEAAVEILKSGATDYVLKDKLFKLNAAVFRALQESKSHQEHKRLEAELKDLAFKLKAIIDNSPDAVVLKDLNGRQVLLNKNAFLLLEASSLSQELQDGLKNTDLQLLESKQVIVVQEKMESKEKNTYFEVVKYPVLDDQGKLIYICAISRDISERVKLEKIKDNLIRDVSHELKTPLALAQMAFEMCERGLKQQDMSQVRQVQEITAKNLKRMRQDLNNILDVFVLSESKPFSTQELCSLEKIIEDIQDSLIFWIMRLNLPKMAAFL